MTIKKCYTYFYYKLYKLFQVDERDWWSEWKASGILSLLISLLILSFLIYYNIFFDRYFDLNLSNIQTYLIFMILFALPNYFIFHHKDQWKAIINEYEQLPKNKNKIGDWVAYSIVIFIIANLIFAFYLMSQIDWTQYR